MRDAQSLLDQLLAFGTERLTVDQVHRLLGTASDDRVAELAAAALDRDPKKALELLGQAADEGLQLGELLDQLMAYWRDLMVVHCAGPEAPGLNVTSKHRSALAEQAKRLTLDTILAGLDILSSTRARLRTSSHGRILFEMALVRLGRLDDLVSLTQLAEAVAKGPIMATAGSPGASAAGSLDASKKKSLTGAEPPAAAALQQPASAMAGNRTALAGAGQRQELTAESLPALWSQVLAQQGPILRFNLEKAGLPAISGPNTLVLRFPPGYNLARDRCQDPEAVSRIEQLLQQITGQKCHFRIEVVGLPLDAGSAAERAGDLENSISRSPSPRDEVDDPPLVKWAKDLLGAKLVKADPGFGASAPTSPERTDPADAEEP
jgi:DNA polymerase-3 subunit gamma/tau